MAVRHLAVYSLIPGTCPALAGVRSRRLWSHCKKIATANAFAMITDLGIGQNIIETVVLRVEGKWNQQCKKQGKRKHYSHCTSFQGKRLFVKDALRICSDGSPLPLPADRVPDSGGLQGE